MTRLTAALLLASLAVTPFALADTRLTTEGDTATLLVDGKPFKIKGAGGDASKELLASLGGNSFRTWGSGPDDKIDDKLAEAQKLGLKVTVGVWLGHERHGFKYSDPKQVAAQFEKAKATVLKYKDNPAVLMWAFGNEMEGYADGGNPLIWKAINDIAEMAKKIDPAHPTMTVIAEVGGQRIPSIHKLCPAIDIVGINSYGGITSIPTRYRAAGGKKPFAITEFGPAGNWEVGKNELGVAPELSSSAKANVYKNAYEVLAKDPLCLGSYVFAWGSKQEATATWFGMFLPDGARTGAVDAIGEAWSGKAPANRVPVIDSLELTEPGKVRPGDTLHAVLKAVDPENDPMTVVWEMHAETVVHGTGGDAEPPTKNLPDNITSSDLSGAVLKAPTEPGVYRVYAFLHDNHDGGAVANTTFLVSNKPKAAVGAHPSVKLPLAVYADGQKAMPWVPSGYMGNNAAISMDEKCTENPHTGEFCLKVTYAASDNFGGVVWQHPENDWGDHPGAIDVSGATRLTFWARGAKGGEKIDFKFGILGTEKKYPDSGGAAMTATLTKEWKQYGLDLDDKDLSKIKTGFVWAAAAQGKPFTFYLDDIQYEAAATETPK